MNNAHPRISCRTLPNGDLSFYVKESGQTLNNISAIAIEGYDDSVFTVFYDLGIPYTRLPLSGKITKYSLDQIINKMDKQIYLVS